MSPTTVLAAVLVTLTAASSTAPDNDYARSGISSRDLTKNAKLVHEYFVALDADKRGDMREAREDLMTALEKGVKKAKAERAPASYSGDFEMLFELSKEDVKELKTKYGKGFFMHTFVDPYTEEGTGVLVSVPKTYAKATEEFLPAIVALKDPVGGDAKDVEGTLIERATAMYGDLVESHIIIVPLGRMEGSGRKAELVEQNESWLTDKGLVVLFTSLRVLSEQLRHDRSRIVLDGWGVAGEEAMRVATKAPGIFAGVVNRGGPLGDEFLLVDNLDYSPIAYLAGTGAVASKDDAEKLTDHTTGIEDEGELYAPSDDALAGLAAWIGEQKRPLAPKEISYKVNDLRFQSANWVKALKINRRPTAKPDDKEFPRVEAKISGNTIDVTTVNVEDLYLYLSDDLVNLDEEVTINVNGDEKVKKVFDREVDFALENRFFNYSGDFGVYTASAEISGLDSNVPE